MKSLMSLILAAVIIGSCFILEKAQSQPSVDYLRATLDILVEETLQGYNSEDYIKFFQYFAKEMSPLTSQQYFRAVYINGYMRQLGKFYFRTFLPQESSLDPDFPMLVYKARFQKYRDVLLIVNFTKEYDNYRIERMRFDKVLSADTKIGR